VQVPQEGLIEVPHDSAEYWDVVEQFKKPPGTKTQLWRHLYSKNDDFAKTGSGQM
jgi:hypothetical protein